MKASDAKARFSELLTFVERGESVSITRHGRPIARLTPEVDDRRARVVESIQGLEAIRPTMPKMTLDEILAWRHEGHRY
ncbi:MAG: type II toxin-antitoxin system prevent-host-death family antitoxin [Caulobacteraceae bacterium]